MKVGLGVIAPWVSTFTLVGLLTVEIAVTYQRFGRIEANQRIILAHIDHFDTPVGQMLADEQLVMQSTEQIRRDIAESLALWRKHVRESP